MEKEIEHTWAIVEIFGHKVIAGKLTIDERFGIPMVRIDVPATEMYPEFTRHYHPNSIYSVSYVSEDAARVTANSIGENPVCVYVPEIATIDRLRAENEVMRQEITELLCETKQLCDGDDAPF